MCNLSDLHQPFPRCFNYSHSAVYVIMWDNSPVSLDNEGFFVVRRARLVWLWYWVGVLVVGCASNASISPTPRSATLTLLGWTLTPATPTPRSRAFRTPTPRINLTFVPTPLPLTLSPPDCYETPVGSLWCFGLVQNSLLVPLEGIIVRVYLLDQDGNLLAQADATCTRALLMPSEQAPYGVMFLSAPASMGKAMAVLVQAVEAVNSSIISLTVRDTQFTTLDSHTAESPVAVMGKLLNEQRGTVTDIMVVVTLFDQQHRVTGYRQLRLDDGSALNVGSAVAFSLVAAPHVLPVAAIQVSAEGRRQ